MPLPLVDGYETVSVAPRRIRLQYKPIAEHAQDEDEDIQKMWCLDVCHHPKEDAGENKWIPTYCFTMTEFLPQGYEVMSWFTSTNARCFFSRCIMCTKMIMDEETEEIIGDLSLFNDWIWRAVKGSHEVVKTLTTEKERVAA
jgi:arylamine N-acetyltransferase